ncbi:hypothetical protein EON77_21560, partial [bacterium]
MKRLAATVVSCLLLAGFVACDDGNDAALRSGGTGPRDELPRPTPDAAPADSGSDAAEPDDAASSSSGSVEPDADAPDAEIVQPGYCRVTDVFGISFPVLGLETVADALEFSITPDERTLAWISTVDGGTSVHVATRATESDAFGAPSEVAYADAAFASTRGLALSADGLHL